MKIGLISPPVFDPSMPYLGPYQLQSYLNKMRPDCEIDVFDLNIKFFNNIIKNPYVNFNFEMDVIDSYFQIIRNEELIKNALLNWSKDKDLTVTRQSIIFNFNRDWSNNVIEYVESKNIFNNSILELLFSNVNIDNYDLIGISIASYEQLIPSLIISKGIKDLDHEKPIVFGGNIISRIGDILLATNLNKYVDYVVKMEGELPLMNLISYLKGEEISTPTNNLIDAKNKTVIDRTKTPNIVDLDSIPLTEFKGVDWDLYYSPISVLPLSLSRGCSWGRCTFCGISSGWCSHYRSRDITNIVDEIDRHVSELKINSFRLVDESPSLSDLLSFSNEIIGRGLDIKIETYLNINKKLMIETNAETLYNAGFRQFFFGLESVDEKILKDVKKGINIPRYYNPILNNLHKHGISNYGFFLIGLPNDNIDNEQKLEEFIIESKNLNTIAISSYIPISNSEIYNDIEYQKRHKIVFTLQGDLTTWCDYALDGKTVEKLVKMRTANMVKRIFSRRKDLFISSNIPYEARFFLCIKYGNEFNKRISNSSKSQHISFNISDELNQRSSGPVPILRTQTR